MPSKNTEIGERGKLNNGLLLSTAWLVGNTLGKLGTLSNLFVACHTQMSKAKQNWRLNN